MDWKKQFSRVKQFGDKQKSSGDRLDNKNESILLLEENHLDILKNALILISKKLMGCLLLHGVDQDKYLKKVPEYSLGTQLIDSSKNLKKGDLIDSIGESMRLCGTMEKNIAEQRWIFEKELENNVLLKFQVLLEKDLPIISKLRKNFKAQMQEVESLKNKFENYSSKTSSQNLSAIQLKQDSLRDELEDAQIKLDQIKDQLETEIFLFLSREGEINDQFLQIAEMQLKYYSNLVNILNSGLPILKQQIERNARCPVFGISIEKHLKQTNYKYAVVIEECIKALLQVAMKEEGLFRIASGTLKVKKLKAAFDAGVVNIEEYKNDPHCISGTLKSYLRELPEPLMTFQLYNDWMRVIQLNKEERVNAALEVVNKLPTANKDNLGYLIHFFSYISSNSATNKMSPANISIVVGPSLIWSEQDDRSSVKSISFESAIVELLISNASILFNNIEFPNKMNFENCYETDDSVYLTPTNSNKEPISSNQTNVLPDVVRIDVNMKGLILSQQFDSNESQIKENFMINHPNKNEMDLSNNLNITVPLKEDEPSSLNPQNTFISQHKYNNVSSSENIANNISLTDSGLEETDIWHKSSQEESQLPNFQFSQMLINNVLMKPPKSKLSRPNTVYEALTANEQVDKNVNQKNISLPSISENKEDKYRVIISNMKSKPAPPLPKLEHEKIKEGKLIQISNCSLENELDSQTVDNYQEKKNPSHKDDIDALFSSQFNESHGLNEQLKASYIENSNYTEKIKTELNIQPQKPLRPPPPPILTQISSTEKINEASEKVKPSRPPRTPQTPKLELDIFEETKL